VWFEGILHDQINRNAKEITQVLFQFNILDQAGRFVKGHQEIEIAIRALLVSDVGAEDAERLHGIAIGEERKLLA
jgi:hypothetical protein